MKEYRISHADIMKRDIVQLCVDSSEFYWSQKLIDAGFDMKKEVKMYTDHASGDIVYYQEEEED